MLSNRVRSGSGIGAGIPPDLDWQAAQALALPAGGSISRASTATVKGHDGYYDYALPNELRLCGARRVCNLAESLSTHTISVEVGQYYHLTIKGEEGATCVSSGAMVFSLTANGINRVANSDGYPKLALSASLTLTVTGVLTELQVEKVYGIVPPSEYVAFDQEHNAGVVGVKYFNYLNGNSVSFFGLVNEQAGASIDSRTIYAPLESELTNYMAYSLGSEYIATPQAGAGTRVITDGIVGPGSAGVFSDTDTGLITYFRVTPLGFDNQSTIVFWLKKSSQQLGNKVGLSTTGITGANTLLQVCVDQFTGEVTFCTKSASILTYSVVSRIEGDVIKVVMQRTTDPAIGNTALRVDLAPSRFVTTCVGNAATTGEVTLLYCAAFWGAADVNDVLNHEPIITTGAAVTQISDVLQLPVALSNSSKIERLFKPDVSVLNWDGEVTTQQGGRISRIRSWNT